MTVPTSLPSVAYLLSYDRDRGRLRRDSLGYMLRAAALSDLWASGDLVDRDDHATAAGRRPPTDPVLREVWAEVNDSPARWRTLVRRNRRQIANAVGAQLDAARVLRIERPASFFRRADIELRNPLALTRADDRIASLLRSAEAPAPRDAALLGVLSVANVQTAITKERRREYADRIATAVATGGPAIPALRHAIRQARSSWS